jgi:hypothetical protein
VQSAEFNPQYHQNLKWQQENLKATYGVHEIFKIGTSTGTEYSLVVVVGGENGERLLMGLWWELRQWWWLYNTVIISKTTELYTLKWFHVIWILSIYIFWQCWGLNPGFIHAKQAFPLSYTPSPGLIYYYYYFLKRQGFALYPKAGHKFKILLPLPPRCWDYTTMLGSWILS